MFTVISNEILAENLHKMVLYAPRIARAWKAGQFVMVRLDQGEERIPLTISDVAGPLGNPTRIRTWGRVACIGCGVGTALLLPIVSAGHAEYSG